MHRIGRLYRPLTVFYKYGSHCRHIKYRISCPDTKAGQVLVQIILLLLADQTLRFSMNGSVGIVFITCKFLSIIPYFLQYIKGIELIFRYFFADISPADAVAVLIIRHRQKGPATGTLSDQAPPPPFVFELLSYHRLTWPGNTRTEMIGWILLHG